MPGHDKIIVRPVNRGPTAEMLCSPRLVIAAGQGPHPLGHVLTRQFLSSLLQLAPPDTSLPTGRNLVLTTCVQQVPWLANSFTRLVVAFCPWLRRRADQALADSVLGFILPGLSAAHRWADPCSGTGR